MGRITVKHLRSMANILNRVTGSPAEPWRTLDDGSIRANVGNYHISGAYGGWCLHRMENESGGVTSVFSCGHVPARDLYNRMRAFADGYETAKRDD